MRMNRVITALCVLNLALIVLAGYFWNLYKREKDEKKVDVQTKYVTNILRKVVVRNPENIDTNPPVLFRRWRDLESTNYLTYIRNLRAFGCPPDIVQDIIIADIARLYEEKRKKLLEENPPKYWKGYDIQTHREYQKLAGQQEKLIMDLFGINYTKYINNLFIPNLPAPPKYYLDFLSQEKQQKVNEILKQNEKLYDELFTHVSSSRVKNLRDKIQLIEQAEEKGLNEILTPEEKREYEIRNSSIAQRIREEFSEIDLTEEEYRRIYTITEKIEKNVKVDLYGSSGAESEFSKAYQEYEKNLKSILGEERYNKYVKLNDTDYKFISEFTESYNVPQETADKLYEFKKAFIKEVNNIASNSSLTFQQRSNIAIALISESEKTLKELLGESVYNEYLDYDDDFIAMCNNLLVDNTATNATPQIQTTNESSQPFPPFPPPPPPPPLLRR